MLKYNALIAGLVLLSLWALLRETLTEATSGALIGIAIVCIGFGAIGHKPAAQQPIRRRKRRKLSASQRAARDARQSLDRSDHK